MRVVAPALECSSEDARDRASIAAAVKPLEIARTVDIKNIVDASPCAGSSLPPS